MKTAREWVRENVNEYELPTRMEMVIKMMTEYAKYYHQQQVKSVDLADVGGSYSVKDMGDAWSAGYHRRADEDNGKEVTSFTDWIEMTYGGK